MCKDWTHDPYDVKELFWTKPNPQRPESRPALFGIYQEIFEKLLLYNECTRCSPKNASQSDNETK